SNQTTGSCFIFCGLFAQWQTQNFAVVASTPVTPVLTSISVAPTTASVQTGGTQQFNATGRDQFGNVMSPPPTFTWSVSGGGTIGLTGLFSATTPGGPFTVTAASGGVPPGTANVTVTAVTPVLTTISVAPATASVQTGGTQQFSATGRDQFGNVMSPPPTFTWSVSGGGTIGLTGLFSATTPGGPFTVTAASGGVPPGTANVTVTAVTPVLTTISVAPSSASVQTGGTQQFSATGRDQFGNVMTPQPTFTWSVSGGGTIGLTGLFSATTPGGPFTVTAASGGVPPGTANVTVTDFSLSANPTTRSIKHGQSTTYAVTITRKFGSNGSVAFTVNGLPSNVTASFGPT